MPNFLSGGIDPSLIHGVDVVLQILSLTATQFDDVYREASTPDGKVYESSVTVLGQMHWVDQDNGPTGPAGDDEMFSGWITMLRRDWEAMPVKIKKGDRIVQVDAQDYSEDPLYIEAVRYKGYYAEPKLIKLLFRARSEVPGNDGSNAGLST